MLNLDDLQYTLKKFEKRKNNMIIYITSAPIRHSACRLIGICMGGRVKSVNTIDSALISSAFSKLEFDIIGKPFVKFVKEILHLLVDFIE